MKKLTLAVMIIIGLAAVALAQRQKGGRSGNLVKADMPAVYVSFLRPVQLEPFRTGYGRNHLLFRITNNTRWAIWLEMNGVTAEYGDAGLFYTIEDEKSGEIRIDMLCHVCSVNQVGAGRSIIFSIPADYASRDSRFRIEYSFAWERDNEAEGGSYSKHSVLFYFHYLPKSVLPVKLPPNSL
ncbi:MAG: hypothetical protein ACRD9R_14050 [Pyrinomonadaceae bacterium]